MATGYIGLGRMGGGMANNLRRVARPLYVHDAQAEAMARFDGDGTVACDTPAAVAAECDLIFLCLPFAPAVRETMFGADGIASAGRSGLTVVDMTTLYRSDARDIGREAADHGISYSDCPVSGMPFRAEDGTLTIMFGGEAEVFARVKPLLDVMGRSVVHCGPPGSGQAMKAFNNIIYNINIAGLCEVLPLTAAAGLDPELVAEIVLDGSSRSFASEYFVPRMMEGDFTKDYPMQDAYKDIVNVRQMADDANASTPVVDAMVGTYDKALEAGLGMQPKSAMLQVYEKALGIKFRKPGFEDT